MTTLEELAAKFEALEKRVDDLAADKAGQDRLNSRTFEMLSEVRDDVALLRRHAIATDARLEKMDARLEKVESRLTKLDNNFTAFQRDLPSLIANTMREVLRERRD
jgi:chromosome segregation ATPase